MLGLILVVGFFVFLKEHSIPFCLFSSLCDNKGHILCLFLMHLKYILITTNLVRNIVNNDKD